MVKVQQIKEGKLSAEENVKQFLNKIKEVNDALNIFLFINEKKALAQAKQIDQKIKEGKEVGKLAGLCIGIKSNISVIDLPITCASKTLENYHGTYDADVITKIHEEDGIILGMLNMDEFASGSSGETSAFGPVHNPNAPGYIPGGSSSGSAAAVAAGLCDIALGSDTGGSIRNPASHCGVVGIKPSYGRVSRYGLCDLSMSLDQIGPLSTDVYSSALMLEVIAGHSENDPTTIPKEVESYTEFFNGETMKVGLSEDFEKLCTDKRIYDHLKGMLENLTGKITVENCKLPFVEAAVQTYYPIVYVEFFSSTRKLDGRKYGLKIEDSCGEEALRRIIGGKEISKAEYEGAYYKQALKVKELISQSIHEALVNVDVLVLPTTPVLPHRLGKDITDPRVMYAYDAYTIPANLAGICAGVIPMGTIDNIPVGLQVYAPAFREKLLFDFLHLVETCR